MLDRLSLHQRYCELVFMMRADKTSRASAFRELVRMLPLLYRLVSWLISRDFRA